ncbi:MAG TPA: hypothetical protein VK503_10120 [Candidatus Bathyarchaeia archaeon]|nr:hypothetical protein [Candidatus Bathyarchaeia archaeon]
MTRQFKLRYGSRFSIILLILVSVLLIPYPHNPLQLASAGSGPTLSAWGTAIVDGVISPGKYGSCITNSLPNVGYAFRFCETNDVVNLYLALEVADTTNNAHDSFYIYFDNNHSGVIAPCISGTTDEALVMNGAVPGMFVDSNYCHSGTTSTVEDDAVQNGVGIRKTGGLGSVYEISHPLCSGDSRDFCLHFGDTVGWCFAYFDETANNGGSFPNNCLGPMYFSGDATSFGNIVIATPPSTLLTSTATTTTEGLPFTSATTLTSSLTSTTTSLGLNVVHPTSTATVVYVQPVTATSARTVTSTTTACQPGPPCSTITFTTTLVSTLFLKSTETATTTETALSPESVTGTRTLTIMTTTTESTTGSYTTTIITTYISTPAATTVSASTTTITSASNFGTCTQRSTC